MSQFEPDPSQVAVENRFQGIEHGEVLAELHRLQHEKAGWSSTIWILVLSLAGFLAVGSAQWDWKFTVLLIPVLLFHETGHWLAMRIFGYRNLRMFFIPFFGAAVTGRHYNVAGWKKALVSLAGPVPGIVLGAALGIFGMATEQGWAVETSVVALLLNGFNLLPFLPLDGGHVLHATLFCRNRWLDIVFRVVAIAGLIALGVFGGAKLLAYISIPFALGLPLAFRLGKVTDNLRQQLSTPTWQDDTDEIPIPVAQSIISALIPALPQRTSSRMIARQALGVFETLNARPPGALATIGLLTIHAGAVLLALFFGGMLVLYKHGAFE